MQQYVPVLKVKLHPPQLPQLVVRRKSYFEFAREVLGSRLTRIVAPAGYGKSTFLAALASDPELLYSVGGGQQAPVVAWYTLDEIDRSPAVFFTHLAHSIAIALGEDFGTETIRTLSSVQDIEKSAGIVSATLAEELWQAVWEKHNSVVLVLDDFHNVTDAPVINDVVNFMLKNMPNSVKLCVASRYNLPLSAERLVTQQKVYDLGPSELSFKTEEIADILARINGTPYNAGLVDEIAATTDGWPAGVVLASRAVTQSGLRSSLPDSIGRETAFKYFAEEIFNFQREEMQKFMVGASLLKYITGPACEAVLGTENAALLLDEAVDKGLFLSAVKAEGQIVYRFHQLFRTYLNSIRNLFPGLEVSGLHRSAARYYEESGLLDAAMDHYIDGGMTGGAVDLLLRRGVELIELGRVDQLRRWLNLLPSPMVESDAKLLYYMGFVYQNSDPARALNCLDLAARGLSKQGELGLEVRALIYMATIYSLQNRVDKVKETSSRIPALAALRKDPWSRGVLTVAALCQNAWEDNLTRGVWLSRLARRLPLDPDWYWALLSYSCMIYYRLGDLDFSRKLIEEALDLSVVKDNDHWRGLALVLYHVVLYSQDDEEASEWVREELWKLGEKYDSAYFKAYAERARSFSFYLRGSLEQSRDLFKSSLFFFEKSGNSAMASITRLDLALLDSQRGHSATAYEDARRAFDELRSVNCGQGLEEFGLSILGVVARESGDMDAAERHLLKSAGVSRRKGSKQILAGTYLNLAQLYAMRGQVRRADDYLEKAMAIASRYSYRVFWDFHRPTVFSQCLRAIERDIHWEYAVNLLAYWFETESLAPLEKMAERGGRGCGKRAMAALARLKTGVEQAVNMTCQECGENDTEIKIRLLGTFEVTINGLTIADRAWQTSKAKTLFKYLIIQRGRRVTREQLMDLLWPDAEPFAAAASLRVTLSRLKKALATADGNGKKTLLGNERGVIWFKPEMKYYLDLEEFEQKYRLGAEALEQGEPGAAREAWEKALDIYRGDLLEEDIYEDWTVGERERFQITMQNMLLALSGIYMIGGSARERDRAIELLNSSLAANPYREEVYLMLMEVYRAAGQRCEALRVYERCRVMLAGEFGVKPGPDMQALAGLIRSEQK